MNTSNLIDLTRTIEHGNPGVEISPARDLRKDGWNAQFLKTYTHSGTHMDAPWHFEVNQTTIDTIPISTFIGPCWLVDIEIIEDRQLIDISDIESQLPELVAGDSILLRTGWSMHFGSDHYKDHLPRISAPLAAWMVEKEVKMLGVEPPSVADVNNLKEVTLIHHIFLKGYVQIIEGLVNLSAITAHKFTLIALPLKIKNGDGAPARVVAMIP